MRQTRRGTQGGQAGSSGTSQAPIMGVQPTPDLPSSSSEADQEGDTGVQAGSSGTYQTPIMGEQPTPDLPSSSSEEEQEGDTGVQGAPGGPEEPPVQSSDSDEGGASKPKFYKINRCVARLASDSSETPIIFGQGLRKLQSRTTFPVALIPDSGATCTVIPLWLVKK